MPFCANGQGALQWRKPGVRTMRLALIACIVSMSAVAGARQTVSRGAAAAPAPRQTQAPRAPAPPPPAGTPPRDIFRNDRRDPFRTRFHAPGVAGFGGFGYGVGSYATDSATA